GVKILKYVVAHDSGTLINPMLVDGQIHGHVWQFISIALGEQCVYDVNGQHLTSTFADYFSQGSADSTSIDVAHLETPSTWAPLGTKAVGEGPTIPVMATIANAIEDALAPLGVKMTEIPMTAETILRSIRSKRHAEDA
ncbi:MAG: molybdopterin-dependent oxidoreductase, partial [Anaerolineales bacterium]|nr:molybdopterin-dependent oxidoreductase [Anaerolineales bacterium]